MLHKPPSDQHIIDEYFSLLTHRKPYAAWLYGMVATFGVGPGIVTGKHDKTPVINALILS